MISSLNALLSEKTVLEANKAGFEAEKAAMQQLAPMTAPFQAFSAVFFPYLNAQAGSSYTSFASIADEAFYTATVQPMLISMAADPNYAPYAAVLGMFASLPLNEAQAYESKILNAAARVGEIDVELANIETRMQVISAMEPSLNAGLEQAKQGYEALTSGQMTASSKLAAAQAQILLGQSKIDEGIEEFKAARENAVEQADLKNIITESMISGILTANNFSMPAGYLEDTTGKYLVKVGDVYGSTEELGNTLLFHTEATGEVRVRDVADVAVQNTSDGTYAKVNGADGIVLSFQKQSTASTADVAHRIADTIETLQAGKSGLRITPLMNQGDYIDMIVGSVLENLLFGGALAILVLLLFLRDWRPTVVIACSIPISLMFAVTLMYFSNITLNIISLSGLALGVGMLVDNSIVVIENIYRMRSQGVPVKKAAVEGAKQVAAAIAASTLTTICVFLPIVFTQGISRQLFTDMGLTIAYSLSASLIVALTLVPAMSATTLRTVSEKKHGLFEKFVNGYEKVLRWSLDHKKTVLLGAVGLLAVAVLGVTVMGTAFIPEMNSEQMSATLSLREEEEGVDLYALSDQVSDAILGIDGVEYVGAMDGGSSMLGMGGGSGSISYYILLSEGRRASNKEIEREIYARTADLAGEVSVQSSTMNMSMLSGSGVELVLKCNDLDVLAEESEKIAEILRTVEGLADVKTGYEGADVELRVTVDKDAAMRYSLTVAQIYSEIASALVEETDSTTVTAGDTDYPVVIIRHNPQNLTAATLGDFKMTVTNTDKEEEEIRLSDIATISQEQAVGTVRRDNQARYNTVTAAVADGYNIGLVSRELEKALESYTPPAGCTLEEQGENETINSALGDLVQMVLLAIVFIYLIMVAQFQSLLSPFIVLFTIPLAFTGGLLLLWICGMELSVISMLGFLVLAGVVVNNGIVFVDYTNQLREEGMKKREALIETGRARVRPILMTALTTILAMSTMALGIGSGAEMTQPMAVVTIGGLTYATLLTLIVVPVVYDLLHRRPMKQLDEEA